MRMLKTKVRPIATGARWAGRPATAVLAYLALKTARPEAGEATVWTKRSVSRFFMICLLPPTSHGTPAFPGSRWGPKIRRFLASVCEKATNDCLLYHQLLQDVLRKVAIDYECRRTLSLTSPRREASLFKLGRSLWFRPFSFLPFPAASDACQRQTRPGHPRPRGEGG